MNNPRLAGRYAKSLLDLATEQSQVDAVYADMKWLHSICKSNPDFVNMLRSPVIKPTAKGKIIDAVTKERVSKLTSAFIQLLVNKARETNLPEIATTYIDQFNALVKVLTLSLVTASIIFPLAVGLITGLRSMFTKSGLLLQMLCNHFISAYTASTWFCSVARSSKLFA